MCVYINYNIRSNIIIITRKVYPGVSVIKVIIKELKVMTR